MDSYLPMLEEYQEYNADMDRLLDKMSRGEELHQSEKQFMNAVARKDWKSAKNLQVLMQASHKADSDPQITSPITKDEEDQEYQMLWDQQMDQTERLGMLQGIGQPSSIANLTWTSMPQDVKDMIKDYLSE